MKSTLKPWVVIVLMGALGVMALCGGTQAAQAALPDPDPASTGDTYT